MNFLNQDAWLWLPAAGFGLALAWLAWARQRQLISAWGRAKETPSSRSAGAALPKGSHGEALPNRSAGASLPKRSPGGTPGAGSAALPSSLPMASETKLDCRRYARGLGGRRFIIKATLSTLAFAMAIVALARPYMESRRVQFQAGTVDVVVLLDVSRSMAARDCKGKSRLACAREILKDQIIAALDHNRLGVIAYAGIASPVVFLTEETSTVAWLADNELKISSAPGQGSAMGQAFALALRYFDQDSAPQRKKLIVLLCDGGIDEETDLSEVAEGLRKRDISLVVAGLGTTAPALIPVEELSEADRRLALTPFYKVDGKEALTALDLSTLGRLTQEAGGQATLVRVDSASSFQLKPLASSLSPVEKAGVEELYFYPCLVFFLLVLLTPLATSIFTRRSAVPSWQQTGGTRQANRQAGGATPERAFYNRHFSKESKL